MTISRQTIQEDAQSNVKPSDARTPQGYTPPKLEKMQKLAQVTGQVMKMTGPV